MKSTQILPFLALLMAQSIFSQIVVDDKTYTPEELVRDILINSPCAIIENVAFYTGTNQGFNGIGYFSNGSPSFPLDAGVILSTGAAIKAVGPNDPNSALIDGNNVTLTWVGDRDLENIIGLDEDITKNSTYIEFDFTPTANTISFKFLMASEEYTDSSACDFSDAFAFLLKPAGTTAEYQNIALIPNTGTPIAVVNIHPELDRCDAVNENYFGGYNGTDSAISFMGQTKVFTANATVIPNERYHIKLVIADYDDGSFDSAVFLEAGSFDIGGSLGGDRTIANGNPGCTGTPITLQGPVIAGATYQWLKNNNPIAGATNSAYDVTTDGSYKVMVDATGTCSNTVGPVQIEFVQPPVITDAPLAIVACETDDDRIEIFDFIENTDRAYGSQDRNEFIISYHKTPIDANNNTNKITLPYTNTDQNETIYLRIAESTQNCFVTASFNISVEKNAIANTVTDYEKCDDTTDGDDANGETTFDLSTKTTEVLGTQNTANFLIKYYTTSTAATTADNTAEITAPINNASNPQEIFVRIQNKNNSNCFDITSFNLIVKPLPTINTGVQLVQCDNDLDGISSFNLTEANELISNNYENETFTYFKSRPNATSNTDAIANPLAYENSTSSKVFANVQSANGCLRIAEVDLVISNTQIPDTFQLTYTECDIKLTADEALNNGITIFNFSEATAQIKGLFPTLNTSVSYYETLENALTEANAISDVSAYQNITPYQQDIFVRVENIDLNSCIGIGKQIKLIASPLPLTNTITPLSFCGDNEVAEFDLNSKTAEVIGSQTETILVSYHTSLANALDNKDPIIGAFTNTSNPQTIYVRAQFDTNNNGIKDPTECYSTDMTFELSVNSNPDLETATLQQCNTETSTTYNLTDSKPTITKENNTIVLDYYETEEDVIANIPITNSEAYTIDVLEKTLIVIGKNTQGCFSKTTLNLQTILYANINTDLDTIEECETDDDGLDTFNITIREAQLLNGIDSETVQISYYISEADAIEGNTNIINNTTSFENTVSTIQTIYIRVDQNGSSCFQLAPLKLSVNSVPPIEFAEQYILCFDENDQAMMPFPTIESGLDATLYSFEWFLGDTADATTLITGEEGANISAGTIGKYWIRAINKNSGCDFFKSTEVIASFVPKNIRAEKTNETFSGNNTIEVTADGNGTYEYKIDDGDYQASNVFSNVAFGERVITVRDTQGCGSKSTIVFVIDHPKFFTPNGDGINDSWNIVGIELLEAVDLTIFDRYGNLVYQINSDSPNWDGTKNGNALPATDYWFRVLFTEEGEQKLHQGHFSLKR